MILLREHMAKPRRVNFTRRSVLEDAVQESHKTAAGGWIDDFCFLTSSHTAERNCTTLR
jgi:hypothetical protein